MISYNSVVDTGKVLYSGVIDTGMVILAGVNATAERSTVTPFTLPLAKQKVLFPIFFGVSFYSVVTPHWVCTNLRRTSPFILITVLLSEESP